MDTEKPTRVRHADTVTLDADLLEKIDAEILQVTGSKRGVRLPRKDYVAYRLRKSPRKLLPEEIEELVTLFYDEERFLREALKEVRTAKARGERAAVDLSGLSIRERKPRKKPAAPKALVIEDSQNTDAPVLTDPMES